MAVPFRCTCGYATEVKDAFAGRGVKCPVCQTVNRVPDPSDPTEAKNPFAGNAIPDVREQQRPREYKVLTQKDKWFSGKFDPERLEAALNSYASQGWSLKGMATASIAGLIGGAREEMIFVLER